jgi:hypothetical protein
MRRLVFYASALVLAPAALAQQTAPIAVPPAPAIVSAPLAPVAPAAPAAPTPPPPGLVTVAAPDNAASAPAPATAAAQPPAAPATPPPPPDAMPPTDNSWTDGKTATLGVLNKVDGSSRTLTVPVGGQAAIGDLTIAIAACVTRPAGRLPDAAIFVTLTNPNDDPGNDLFRGWMVRSTPGASVVGDAGEMFRVIDCS